MKILISFILLILIFSQLKLIKKLCHNIQMLNIFKFKLPKYYNTTKIDQKMSKTHHSHIHQLINNNSNVTQTKSKNKEQNLNEFYTAYQTNNKQSNIQMGNKHKAQRISGDEVKKKESYANLESKKVNQSLQVKKMNDMAKKKQSKKSLLSKRPQTPDPTLAQKNEGTVKFPKPQIILKQIQKNVNFLKEMYYASISQHNSLSHKNSGSQDHEDKFSQSHFVNKQGGHGFSKERDDKKSFDSNFPKKSVPQISIVPNFQPFSTQNTKNFNSKVYQQFVGTEPKKQNKKLKSRSNQCKQNNKQRRKSSSNLHKGNQKTAKQDHNNQQQVFSRNSSTNFSSPIIENTKTNNEKGTNINSLFQIFKYYKRSIDSSLSKRASVTQLQPNSQVCRKSADVLGSNVYISACNKNQERSYGKQTPNNSTTKNTNHKNSTTSRNCGSSFDPSIQVSMDDNEECYKQTSKINKDERKSSKSKSANKEKDKKKSVESKQGMNKKSKPSKILGSKDVTKNKKSKQCSKQKQDTKLKNYICEIQHKKIKQDNKKSKQKHSQQKNKQQIIKSSEQLVIEPFKKKTNKKIMEDQKNNKNYETNEHNVPHNYRTSAYQLNHTQQEQKHDKIQFPEIQSSLFDRNMPILEQDSRQEASSQFIAITGQKDPSENTARPTNKQPQTNLSHQKNGYWAQNKENNTDAFNVFERHQLFQNLSQSKGETKKIFKQTFQLKYQIERVHTPPFSAFENSKGNEKQCEIKEKGIERKQQKSKQTKKSDDSLAGFEIPKKDQDSDLDNFELVSFEL